MLSIVNSFLLLKSTRFLAPIICVLLLHLHHQPTIGAQPPDNQFRIHLGVEARIGQCPYHVGVIDKIAYSHICGGSIIGRRRVLTAAHCVERGPDQSVLPGDSLAVRAGSNALWNLNSTQALYTLVERVTVHPRRDIAMKRYDFAVLRTADDLFDERTMNRQPVRVASHPMPVGSRCTLCGWGKTERGEQRDELLFVRLNITDLAECGEHWQRNMTSDTLCARGLDGRDAGSGDGGAGLVCNRRLVGLSSFGEAFSPNARPTVYSNVWLVREWAIDGDPTAALGVACDLRPWWGTKRLNGITVAMMLVWWTVCKWQKGL